MFNNKLTQTSITKNIIQIEKYTLDEIIYTLIKRV